MLKPHKFLDYNTSVIRLSSLILIELIKHRIIKYNDLYKKVYDVIGDELQYTFLASLDFLFLLGKLEYHQETDTLELIM